MCPTIPHAPQFVYTLEIPMHVCNLHARMYKSSKQLVPAGTLILFRSNLYAGMGPYSLLLHWHLLQIFSRHNLHLTLSLDYVSWEVHALLSTIDRAKWAINMYQELVRHEVLAASRADIVTLGIRNCLARVSLFIMSLRLVAPLCDTETSCLSFHLHSTVPTGLGSSYRQPVQDSLSSLSLKKKIHQIISHVFLRCWRHLAQPGCDRLGCRFGLMFDCLHMRFRTAVMQA